MDKAYQRAINEKIRLLSESIGELKALAKYEPQWSLPQPLSERESHGSGLSSAIGCYKIIYIPTNEVMDIGQGNIANRKNRHKSCFLNEGKPLIHEGGTMTASTTALHMWKFDTDIENWAFSWCDLGSKHLAEEYEKQLIDEHQPQFNSVHMGGK